MMKPQEYPSLSLKARLSLIGRKRPGVIVSNGCRQQSVRVEPIHRLSPWRSCHTIPNKLLNLVPTNLGWSGIRAPGKMAKTVTRFNHAAGYVMFLLAVSLAYSLGLGLTVLIVQSLN